MSGNFALLVNTHSFPSHVRIETSKRERDAASAAGNVAVGKGA